MHRGEPLWGSQRTRAYLGALASCWCFFLPSWGCVEMLKWGLEQRQLYVYKHLPFFCMNIFLHGSSRDTGGMYIFTWARRESFPSQKDQQSTRNGISSFFLYFNGIWPKQREESWQDVLHSPLLCGSNSTLKKKNLPQIKYHLFQLCVLSQHHSVTVWNAEQCKKNF